MPLPDTSQHRTLFVILTVCYVLTGASGPLVALGRIVNVGSSRQDIGREKSSAPIDSRPYFTSCKHIPPSERPLSPAMLLAAADLGRALDEETQLAELPAIIVFSSPFDDVRTSRAPPFQPLHS